MANSRDVSIRIAVVDGDKTRRELTLVGEEGQRAMEAIRNATKPAGEEMKLLNGVVEEAKSKMEEFSEHGGAVSRVLAEIGPAGAAAAAAIGALVYVIEHTVEEAEKFEQGQRRIGAVLKATGDAAGLSKQELTEFAEEYAHSTLNTSEQVQQAEAELLTFKNVQGDVFKDAIKLASDTATVWNTDLTGAIRGLGRALNDPIEGLAGLTRAHINLTAAEKAHITTLAQSGHSLEAQKAILDAVRNSVGGSSEGQDAGMTGATKHLSESFGELSRAVGQNIEDTGILQSVFGAMTERLKTFRKEVRGTASEDLAALDARIKAMEKDGSQFLLPGGYWEDPGYGKMLAQRAKLQEQVGKEEEDAANARRQADISQEKLHGDALLSIQSEIADKIKEQSQTEREKVIEDINTLKQRINNEAGKDGSNADSVQERLDEADKLKSLELGKIDAEAAQEAIKLAEANQKVIDTLQKRVALQSITDPKQQFIAGETDKLNDSATQQQIDQAKQLAAALYDETEAQKAAAAAAAAHDKAVQEINQQLAKSKTSFADAEQGIDAWKKQLLSDLGTGTEESEKYAEKVQEIYDQKLHDAYYKSLQDSKDWSDGAILALHKYSDEATNTAKLSESAFNTAAKSIEDGLADLATKGKISMESLKSTVQSIENDMLHSFIKQNITGPGAGYLSNLLKGGGNQGGGDDDELSDSDYADMMDDSGGGGGGFLSSIFSSVFHSGGVVGQSLAGRRALPAWAFAGAPRLHSGLMPDEFPAILQRGETVIPKNGKGSGMHVTMNITTPNAQSFMDAKGQVMNKYASEMQRYQRRNG